VRHIEHLEHLSHLRAERGGKGNSQLGKSGKRPRLRLRLHPAVAVGAAAAVVAVAAVTSVALTSHSAPGSGGSASAGGGTAPFSVTSSSPGSGPASGGTLIVIHGSGFSSVNNVVMNSLHPLPEENPNYYKQNLHPRFSVVSDSQIDVTTTPGAADLTHEIDFFTPTDDYFTTNFHGIPLYTYK
jgi:hypothetical protein